MTWGSTALGWIDPNSAPKGHATVKSEASVKIRMLIDIANMFENRPEGVRRGEIVELSSRSAERYVNAGIATEASSSYLRMLVAQSM
jgi:hypothetical protein